MRIQVDEHRHHSGFLDHTDSFGHVKFQGQITRGQLLYSVYWYGVLEHCRETAL